MNYNQVFEELPYLSVATTMVSGKHLYPLKEIYLLMEEQKSWSLALHGSNSAPPPRVGILGLSLCMLLEYGILHCCLQNRPTACSRNCCRRGGCLMKRGLLSQGPILLFQGRDRSSRIHAKRAHFPVSATSPRRNSACSPGDSQIESKDNAEIISGGFKHSQPQSSSLTHCKGKVVAVDALPRMTAVFRSNYRPSLCMQIRLTARGRIAPYLFICSSVLLIHDTETFQRMQ